MSSSNLAVSMEHAATDQPSTSARPELRIVASNERQEQKVRPRISFTNRKFINRDQGLRYFRVR